MFKIYIPGIPTPQGSKNAYKRGTRVLLVEANKNLPAWRKALVEALKAELAGNQPFPDAVTVEVLFIHPRAKTNRKRFMTQKPDLDKLQRALGDALTIAGVIKDDSCICKWIPEKDFDDELPAGAYIEIYPYQRTRRDKWI